MNILPKKKWHVRTKENIARVRRDEAKAAADEKARLDRIQLAEHEDRMNRLKRNAGIPIDDPFVHHASNTQGTSGHINFFADLEEQELKNLSGSGNKEYQAEKKREQHEWESKMGIMKRFAEDTKELTGATSWWEKIDRAEPDPKVEVKPETPKKSEKELRREVKRQIKEEKRKKKAKKRRRHSSSSSSDSEKEEAKKRKLEALRKERLERELAEQQRVRQLVREEKPISDAEKERRYTYSNQFNPDLVRRR